VTKSKQKGSLEVTADGREERERERFLSSAMGILAFAMGGDLAPSLGETKKIRGPNFRMTFFRKKFTFKKDEDIFLH